MSLQFQTHQQDEIKLKLEKDLVSWYDKSQRVLPWRKPSTTFSQNSEIGKQRLSEWDAQPFDHAYAVLVSEIMLQQTKYLLHLLVSIN